MLPFAATPKRPKGPDGKIREGVYQSARRYRPLVATNLRLFVINAVRTPYPRGVLADFPLSAVTVVDMDPAESNRRLYLDLPEIGTVPFDLGRFDLIELDEFRETVGRG